MRVSFCFLLLLFRHRCPNKSKPNIYYAPMPPPLSRGDMWKGFLYRLQNYVFSNILTHKHLPRIIRKAEDIICGAPVKSCKANKHVRGYIADASFVSAVLRLLHLKIIRHVLLGKVTVLSQILYSGIIAVHIKPFLNNVITVWY